MIVRFEELKERAFNRKVQEVMRLRTSSDFERIIDCLVPFLLDRDAVYDKDEEMELLLENTNEYNQRIINKGIFPNGFRTEWKGFYVYFLLDWSKKVKEVSASDYVTMEMAEKYQLSETALLNIATENITAQENAYFVLPVSNQIDTYNIFNNKVFLFKTQNESVPNYGSSIIMNQSIMEYFKNQLGNKKVWVFPLYQQAVVLITDKDIANEGPAVIDDIVCSCVNEKFSYLSSRCFEIADDGTLYEEWMPLF